MELIMAYNYILPGPFQAAINRQLAKDHDESTNGFWVTTEGQMLRPRQMTDSHLMHCIRITEERHKAMPMRAVALSHIRSKYSKNNFNRIQQEFFSQMFKSRTYIELIREARRRGFIQHD